MHTRGHYNTVRKSHSWPRVAWFSHFFLTLFANELQNVATEEISLNFKRAFNMRFLNRELIVPLQRLSYIFRFAEQDMEVIHAWQLSCIGSMIIKPERNPPLACLRPDPWLPESSAVSPVAEGPRAWIGHRRLRLKWAVVQVSILPYRTPPLSRWYALSVRPSCRPDINTLVSRCLRPGVANPAPAILQSLAPTIIKHLCVETEVGSRK